MIGNTVKTWAVILNVLSNAFSWSTVCLIAAQKISLTFAITFVAIAGWSCFFSLALFWVDKKTE